jgi:eukaryotic-like serine/threonine-protein kinase
MTERLDPTSPDLELRLGTSDPYGAAASAAAAGVRWPDASAYAIAARDVASFFTVPELQGASLRRSPLGLPLPATGRNAAVFKATVDGADLAVRVFTRAPNDGPERYRRIGEHISHLEGVLFPNVRWLDDSVHVGGATWPMIRMDWVEGLTLDHWVGAHRHDPELLRDFARRWDELFKFLEHSRIAHGDLQHGNVLVDAQHRVRLVDLDGMWIPALVDHPADEFGHVHFQHPGRLSERVWGERMDGFSSLLIAVSLVALSHRPELWERYNDGGNNLIFRNDHFTDLDAPIWADIAEIDDDVLRRRLDKLREACGSECAKLAGPVVMLDDDQRSALVPGSPSWLLSAMGATPQPVAPPSAPVAAPTPAPPVAPAPTPVPSLPPAPDASTTTTPPSGPISEATVSFAPEAFAHALADLRATTPVPPANPTPVSWNEPAAPAAGVPVWVVAAIAAGIVVLAIVVGLALA